MSRVRIGYRDRSFQNVMRYPGKSGHIVTVAPTGSGKGRDVNLNGRFRGAFHCRSLEGMQTPSEPAVC